MAAESRSRLQDLGNSLFHPGFCELVNNHYTSVFCNGQIENVVHVTIWIAHNRLNMGTVSAPLSVPMNRLELDTKTPVRENRRGRTERGAHDSMQTLL